MARFVGIRAPGASKRRTSAETAAAFRQLRDKRSAQPPGSFTGEVCATCGKQRRKHELGWRWIYPDRSPPYTLEPLAVVCPSCPQDDSPLTDREVR